MVYVKKKTKYEFSCTVYSFWLMQNHLLTIYDDSGKWRAIEFNISYISFNKLLSRASQFHRLIKRIEQKKKNEHEHENNRPENR